MRSYLEQVRAIAVGQSSSKIAPINTLNVHPLERRVEHIAERIGALPAKKLIEDSMQTLEILIPSQTSGATNNLILNLTKSYFEPSSAKAGELESLSMSWFFGNEKSGMVVVSHNLTVLNPDIVELNLFEQGMDVAEKYTKLQGPAPKPA